MRWLFIPYFFLLNAAHVGSWLPEDKKRLSYRPHPLPRRHSDFAEGWSDIQDILQFCEPNKWRRGLSDDRWALLFKLYPRSFFSSQQFFPRGSRTLQSMGTYMYVICVRKLGMNGCTEIYFKLIPPSPLRFISNITDKDFLTDPKSSRSQIITRRVHLTPLIYEKLFAKYFSQLIFATHLDFNLSFGRNDLTSFFLFAGVSKAVAITTKTAKKSGYVIFTKTASWVLSHLDDCRRIVCSAEGREVEKLLHLKCERSLPWHPPPLRPLLLVLLIASLLIFLILLLLGWKSFFATISMWWAFVFFSISYRLSQAHSASSSWLQRVS